MPSYSLTLSKETVQKILKLPQEVAIDSIKFNEDTGETTVTFTKPLVSTKILLGNFMAWEFLLSQ